MSDFFDDEPAAAPRPHTARRRPRPLVLTLVTLAVLLVLFSIFTGIWTERLWFNSVGYSGVFGRLIGTRVLLFVVFGLVLALIVGGNLAIAFRLRPLFRPNSPEQASLDRYREVITPIRWWLLAGTSVIFGVFGGASAAGEWRNFLLWVNREPFGKTDPYFHKDVGFYVFTLPWLHYVIDFLMTAMVLGLLAAVLVHYVFGGIRLQAATNKVSGAAQAQISALFGLFILLKAGDYWLDRFDLTSQGGGLVTGMTYSRDHAVLPSKNILMAIAVICALIFFANIVRRTWLLPGVGLALFALSAVLLGIVWPSVVQRFQVKPDEPDKEASYIQKNITATRDAFNLKGAIITPYDASTKLTKSALDADKESQTGIRLIDPTIVTAAFQQLQQGRGYYEFPAVLDVDRYPVAGRERDMVVAAREMHVEGLPEGQRNWANEHTVYTHGYGMIAAYGNQQDASGRSQNTDEPVWAEKQMPPTGELSAQSKGGYRPQIYFGEHSPEYSVVGRAKGGKAVELDVPEGAGVSGSKTNTYAGKDGVDLSSRFNRLLYAVKFGDATLLLSSRVHENSRILYDRAPRERVQKVAPWLTVDNDALPAVVDGKIVWILDGYTTSDKYPLAEKKSLQEMTSDAISPRTAYATLPTDQINYMRNAVKATVDAYDGTVTLYEWDSADPVLKTWEKAFPGVVKKRSAIPQDLLEHMRYPEDLFKVQRDMLARYHVTNPRSFYEGNDRWDVPEDPNQPTRKQAPYRLSVATKAGNKPVFSITSVYVPNRRQNLAAFVAVGADASDPKTYGKLQMLRLPDSPPLSGPSQIANEFKTDPKVANDLLPFTRGGESEAKVIRGNLLTLPVGGGLLYAQPLYTQGGGGAAYPVLRFVTVSFGDEVGIGRTVAEAIDDITGETPAPQDSPAAPGKPGGSKLTAASLDLLNQADAKFTEADAALKAGDPVKYAQLIEEARGLVDQALAASK